MVCVQWCVWNSGAWRREEANREAGEGLVCACRSGRDYVLIYLRELCESGFVLSAVEVVLPGLRKAQYFFLNSDVRLCALVGAEDAVCVLREYAVFVLFVFETGDNLALMLGLQDLLCDYLILFIDDFLVDERIVDLLRDVLLQLIVVVQRLRVVLAG